MPFILLITNFVSNLFTPDERPKLIIAFLRFIAKKVAEKTLAMNTNEIVVILHAMSLYS